MSHVSFENERAGVALLPSHVKDGMLAQYRNEYDRPMRVEGHTVEPYSDALFLRAEGRWARIDPSDVLPTMQFQRNDGLWHWSVGYGTAGQDGWHRFAAGSCACLIDAMGYAAAKLAEVEARL